MVREPRLYIQTSKLVGQVLTQRSASAYPPLLIDMIVFVNNGASLFNDLSVL